MNGSELSGVVRVDSTLMLIRHRERALETSASQWRDQTPHRRWQQRDSEQQRLEKNPVFHSPSVESGRAPYWTLVARLGVIHWSLVAHTNSRL